MDPIKEAFSKIKEDISSLKDELTSLKQQINALNSLLDSKNLIPTDESPKPHTNERDSNNPTHNPTDDMPLYSPLSQNLGISTGNWGVPTNKPTNKQTNQQTDNSTKNNDVFDKNIQKNVENEKDIRFGYFERARQILDSLDDIKKGVRIKFKRLTNQEMIVFSTLYALEEQNLDDITYKIIAQNLNLSESSIREYITKLMNKGIPINKMRLQNKKIVLKISDDLKKIASLSTIVKLREL